MPSVSRLGQFTLRLGLLFGYVQSNVRKKLRTIFVSLDLMHLCRGVLLKVFQSLYMVQIFSVKVLLECLHFCNFARHAHVRGCNPPCSLYGSQLSTGPGLRYGFSRNCRRNISSQGDHRAPHRSCFVVAECQEAHTETLAPRAKSCRAFNFQP